jgi:serine/threonine protein kinase
MAPEVIEGLYSTNCDMWSAGVVLLLLILGRNPFKGKSKEETFEKIRKDTVTFSGTLFAIQVKNGKNSVWKSRKSSWVSLKKTPESG